MASEVSDRAHHHRARFGSSRGHGDHAEAEQLLVRLHGCTNGPRRRRLTEQIVLLTLDLADDAARRYRGRGIDIEDLQQVARLALVKAIRRYEPGRGEFASFALPTITGEIKRHFRDCGWTIRPPRRLQELRVVLRVEEERLLQRLGRSPTTEELAEAAGATCDDVAEARLASGSYQVMSLDARERSARPSQPPADSRDHVTALVEHEALVQCLERLSGRDRRLIELRFVSEMTQSEIGEAIGVSQMQVSRLLSSLIRRLRAGMLLPEADLGATPRVPSRRSAG